jgi:hypothetical protein
MFVEMESHFILADCRAMALLFVPSQEGPREVHLPLGGARKVEDQLDEIGK